MSVAEWIVCVTGGLALLAALVNFILEKTLRADF